MAALSRLLGKLNLDDAEAEPLDPRTDAEIEADEKRARIKYHRDHVRNGPVKLRYATAGQQRRAGARARETFERKLNVNHRRKFRNGERMAAILRGQLQAVGALPYATDFRPPAAEQRRAAIWIVERFGERNEEGELILHDDILPESAGRALQAYDEMTGRRARADKQAQLDALRAANARVDAGGQFGVAE